MKTLRIYHFLIGENLKLLNQSNETMSKNRFQFGRRWHSRGSSQAWEGYKNIEFPGHNLPYHITHLEN